MTTLTTDRLTSVKYSLEVTTIDEKDRCFTVEKLHFDFEIVWGLTPNLRWLRLFFRVVLGRW